MIAIVSLNQSKHFNFLLLSLFLSYFFPKERRRRKRKMWVDKFQFRMMKVSFEKISQEKEGVAGRKLTFSPFLFLSVFPSLSLSFSIRFSLSFFSIVYCLSIMIERRRKRKKEKKRKSERRNEAMRKEKSDFFDSNFDTDSFKIRFIRKDCNLIFFLSLFHSFFLPFFLFSFSFSLPFFLFLSFQTQNPDGHKFWFIALTPRLTSIHRKSLTFFFFLSFFLPFPHSIWCYTERERKKMETWYLLPLLGRDCGVKEREREGEELRKKEKERRKEREKEKKKSGQVLTFFYGPSECLFEKKYLTLTFFLSSFSFFILLSKLDRMKETEG